MTVRAVVFDVGNVLFDWHPRYLYEKLIPDAAAREAFLHDVVTVPWHFQHDAGRPFAETSAELSAQFPEHRDLIAAWGPRFNETIPAAIPGMPALVASLAAADVPLYAITNFSGEFWIPFRQRESVLFAPFRDIVVSGDEKLIKPDPAIYRLARRRFGLAAGEALFVDDKIENIVASEAEGFVGHHFIDAPTLAAQLRHHRLIA